MAVVRLGRFEAEEGNLPHVCIRCGAPARPETRRTFTYRRGGFLPSGLPLVLTAYLPVCRRHQLVWRLRTLVRIGFAVLAVISITVAFLGTAGLPAKGGPGHDVNPVFDVAGLTFVFSLLGFLFSLLVFPHTYIEADEITETSITLTGVCEEFIAALEEQDEQRRRRRRAARRAAASTAFCEPEATPVAEAVPAPEEVPDVPAEEPDGPKTAQRRCADRMEIRFQEGDEETADWIETIYQTTARVAGERWGLTLPSRIRFVVFRKWWQPVLRMGPFWLRPLQLLFLFPLRRQFKKQWQIASVWPRIGKSSSLIGLKSVRLVRAKPPLVIAASWAKRAGAERNPEEAVGDTVRGQLMKALVARCRPPLWLMMGMTGIAYEQAVGARAAPPDLAAFFEAAGPLGKPARVRVNLVNAEWLPQKDKDRLFAPFELAYWVTRYVEEQRPGLIRALFQEGCRGREFEKRIARELGISVRFREVIVERTAEYFTRRRETPL